MTNEEHTRVLRAAYQAWMNAAGLRQSRLRNKRFTYGDQWGDLVRDHQGRVMTEGEHLANQGCESITNNLIRKMVKTIVGRFRSQYIGSSVNISDVTSLIGYLLSGTWN